MDIEARIRRRQRSEAGGHVVREYEALSPVAHVEEPTGRGAFIERLLDHFAPVFDGELPPDAYVWGPAGAGKSAVVTALFEKLSRLLTRPSAVIHTSTRPQTTGVPAFVYVDARRARSPFALMRAVLDAVIEDSVPRQGISTETLRSRLVEHFRPVQRSAVVAVDHLGEPGGPDLSTLAETFSPVERSLSWVAVGRVPPGDVDADGHSPAAVEMPAYERHALAELLTARGSDGLADGAVDYDQILEVADWAEGDAHDALAALFGAADLADAAGYDRVRAADLADGMAAVPRPSAPLGRVHTLPENRQQLLRRLVDLDDRATASVDAAATAIAESPTVDLSAGTVKRALYELTEVGILRRVRSAETASAGRPPSRIEPRFPTLVFRRLYDLRNRE
jgi:Cdc6-like AAA superfamily ATPase